jgi:soluble lytic murein transglycosylase-like protein
MNRYQLASFMAGSFVVFTGIATMWKPAPACSPADVQTAIIAAERPAMGSLERTFWQQAIATAAAAQALPADVLTAKIAQESRFKCCLISNRDARGASQLMPMHVKGFDPFEIEANLAKGAEVLAAELKRYNGDTRRALRHYNGGNDADAMPLTAAYADAILAKVYLAREKACHLPKEKTT